MTPTWVILAVPAALYAAYRAIRAICHLCADMRRAADVARRVRERDAETELLEHLYAMESAGERP